jgi:hypothetical protein
MKSTRSTKTSSKSLRTQLRAGEMGAVATAARDFIGKAACDAVPGACGPAGSAAANDGYT